MPHGVKHPTPRQITLQPLFMSLLHWDFCIPIYVAHVGADVGEFVGECVGANVGELVGDRVGANVGEFVGDSVGAIVGEFDGDSVGANVGEFVGDAVGDCVGGQRGGGGGLTPGHEIFATFPFSSLAAHTLP